MSTTVDPAASQSPEELVQGVIKLVSLPDVYFRLEELMYSNKSTANDFADIINNDPALATRLLKMANSAFYGFPSRIDSLSRAITIVGTRELRDIVLATVAVESLNKIPNDLVDMSTFWHHSVYCGVTARLMAKRCHILHTERLFLAGLIHDVGQLVIYYQLPELARKVLEKADDTDSGLYAAERKILGFTHGEVGRELFKLWGIPESLQEIAECHHIPADAREFHLETAIVHLANSVVNTVEPGRNINECEQQIDSGALKLSNLGQDDFPEILAEADAQFMEVIKLISPDAPLV